MPGEAEPDRQKQEEDHCVFLGQQGQAEPEAGQHRRPEGGPAGEKEKQHGQQFVPSLHIRHHLGVQRMDGEEDPNDHGRRHVSRQESGGQQPEEQNSDAGIEEGVEQVAEPGALSDRGHFHGEGDQ